MKLQVSFDMTNLEKALSVAHEIVDHVDILEIGLLLVYKHGAHAVHTFREAFPDKEILADIKLIDRGYDAIPLFAEAGANWVTVMAGTTQNVIHATCNEAEKRGVKVMIDLLDSSSLGQSALEAKNVGASGLVYHQPYDEKESLLFLDNWDMIRGNTNLPIFVSAKINRENVHEVIKVKPDGIIVGKSITGADNPGEEAAFYREICKES